MPAPKPFPGIEKVPFLKNAYIEKYSKMAGLEETDIRKIIAVKDALLTRDSFMRLLWDLHDLLYRQELKFSEVLPEDPKLERILGEEQCGVFYFLLVLSGFPFGIRNYESRGWDDAMRDSAFRDMAVWVAHYKRNFGTPGIAWMILVWLQGHLNCTLLSFGRLQFNLRGTFRSRTFVFRNNLSREVTALSDAGFRYTADGIRDDLGKTPSPGSWVSIYRENESSYTGNRITPDGRAERDPISLPKSDWDPVLSFGDPVLNIHIPEGGALTHALCVDSMRRAMDFFRRYEPDYHWKAFFCSTWLLDPQLQKILPPDSNILAFQRAAYLIPYPGKADTVFRVFGIKADRDGAETVPVRTSLQRTLLKFIRDGGKFHSGAMFLLREDADGRENPYGQRF